MTTTHPLSTSTPAGIERLVFGTSNLQPNRAAADVLDAFYEGGGRLLDTAHRYGHGAAEEAVGSWLRSARPDGMALIGKGGHPADDWRSRTTRDDLLTDARESADRLGVPGVDVFLLHRDDPSREVAELLADLSAVVHAGLAGAVGVSNWSADRVRLAITRSSAPAAVSNHFGLGVPAGPAGLPGLVSTFDTATHLALQEHGTPLLAWSAMSSGFFADQPPDRDLGTACSAHPESRRRREILHRVARQSGVAPEAVLVRWLVTAAPTLFPVVATSRPERAAALCHAAGDAGLDPAVQQLIQGLATGTDAALRPLLFPEVRPTW